MLYDRRFNSTPTLSQLLLRSLDMYAARGPVML
ncbi:hypothetical protein BN2475_670003 [Paraburkholderia ribeironis]|uniref:Uncharacterized protein n=1 Tax=Paraburkholderia ribeironis TaxID=1247936 RepID=A0A1N7SGK3_9BURK|nr:hypothetical protein BN2475_670003 [Paraburkholderia ribeironis]